MMRWDVAVRKDGEWAHQYLSQRIAVVPGEGFTLSAVQVCIRV